MYSVVLLAALTTGGDVPAGLFNHGSCGGQCSGCVGSCHGYSCKGGHHARRSHGCQGVSCCGTSCCGVSHRSHGCNGSYGCNGCSGRSRHHRNRGCCGCQGVVTCAGSCGGTIVVPAAPVVPPVKAKTSLDNAAPATLIVSVPAEARLTIDGQTTTSTSTQRVFVTPALNLDRVYNYTVEAEFVREGKSVKLSKEVAVKAGEETRVQFDDNANRVASR
jgi:uncharacterized protein (TIGR03000 family)